MLTIILVIFLLFALVMLFIISSAFFGFLITRVPFIPTTSHDIEFIVKELNISSKDVFYDLGSGNGKVVFLVEKLTGAKVKGFEQTLWTHLWAKMRLMIKDLRLKIKPQNQGESPKRKIEFSNKNFFRADWSKATIIYSYLYPMVMGKVEEKYKTDCKPGTLAIIRDFPFPNMPYKQKYYLPKAHEMYVYKL